MQRANYYEVDPELMAYLIKQEANYYEVDPELMAYLIKQEALIKQKVEANIGLTIWELLKLRASQLNQCAYYLAMHSKQALGYGESIHRIITLNAWQNT